MIAKVKWLNILMTLVFVVAIVFSEGIERTIYIAAGLVFFGLAK